MAAGQLAVGDGDDLVGVVVQLMQGDLVIRAQNVAQKVHNQHIVPFQFLFHGVSLLFSVLRGALRLGLPGGQLRLLLVLQHTVGHLAHQRLGQLVPEFDVVGHGVLGDVLAAVGQ